LVAAAGWFLLAIGVGSSHMLTQLHPPYPQVVLVGVTLTCLLVVVGIRPIRGWALSVDERVLVAFHLSRFVGVYFILLYSRGELPYGFAVVGGLGDIVVAAIAVVLIATGGARRRWRRTAYAVWNVFGFVDILLVVGLAARSALADPTTMRSLQQLPMNLLLTYVVPIIIVTHLMLGYRFAMRNEDATL
jgi:hypothetical protein